VGGRLQEATARGGMTHMSTTLLPSEFSDLEPFAAKWCLPTEHERYAARLASTMDEMQALYDAAMPRADAAMTYLDQFPLDALSEEQVNLLHLLYSMVMVSFPVECWGQPRVPDSGAAYLDLLVEPGP
jgi:hypothetical protein